MPRLTVVIAIPAEVLLYVPSAGTFTVTADLTAFRETFGPAFPVVSVVLYVSWVDADVREVLHIRASMK